MRLYLVRHGKPASTWGGADADPGLDPAGYAQAAAAADQMMAFPMAARPIRVISSPLRRCRETAEPLARALGISLIIDPAVGEIPTPAHLAESERPAWLRTAFQGRWRDIRGDIDYEAWRRSVASAALGYAGAAVFSHFVAINAAISVAADDDRVIVFRPDHASVTTMAIAEGRLTVERLGAEAATGVL